MPEHSAAGITGDIEPPLPVSGTPAPPLTTLDTTTLRAGDIAIVNRPTVTCRQWMSSRSPEIGKLRQHNKVELLGDPTLSGGGLWVKVRSVVAGIEGFLPLRFLDVKELRTADHSDPEFSQPPADLEGPLQVDDVFATTVALNLRRSPGKGAEVVAGIPGNSSGRVLTAARTVDDIDWIEVQMPESTGWMAAKFTRPLARGGKWIEVDLGTQTLTAWTDATITSVSPISSGKPGFRTPLGSYSITTKWPIRQTIASAGGESWNIPSVPWVMVFRTGGFYIHGAYWHDDFGAAVSHGCVTLPVPFAEWLYAWSPPGTRIWIHA